MADCNEKKENAPSEIMKKAEEFLASKRKIFLWGGVDDESAERIVKELLYLDSLNHEDIYFFINSPGGVISSGLAIYDCMNAIQSDVVTVCCGQAASMRIMIHQPLIHGEIVAPASDIQIQAEEMLRIRNITGKILAETSGHTMEEIDRDTERDNFMSAEEAKAYGLVDKVESIV